MSDLFVERSSVTETAGAEVPKLSRPGVVRGLPPRKLFNTFNTLRLISQCCWDL